LGDFGLSRIKADATSRTASANAGGLAGTRNWMAPEQLMGRALKKPCDIYAFGMMLYEVSVALVMLHMLNVNSYS
jgi:serine/threonine protein kinase